MPRIIVTVFCLLLISILSACGDSKQSGYHGYLYFANGSYLMTLALRDGSISVVTSLGNRTIHDISPYGENRLLVAESALVNRKEVHSISWLDVKTGQTSVIYLGVFARYFVESGLMIYDDGRRLFLVNQAGDLSTKTVFTHGRSQVLAIMTIADDTVLFETSAEGLQGIYSYNVLSGELLSLDQLSGVCRLKNAVWIGDLQQLACKMQTQAAVESGYILAQLDGKVSRSLALPEGKRFDALTYIPGQGALILRERRDSILGDREISSAWVHNIYSGESLLLAKNKDLGDSVVYADY